MRPASLAASGLCDGRQMWLAIIPRKCVVVSTELNINRQIDRRMRTGS